MLLTIHDANLAQVGWIDNDKEDTLNFFNDTWTRYLETGASTFEFSVFKKAVQSDLPFAKSYMALNDRAFVSFVYKGETFVFSLMELEEDEHTIRCVGENLNMELINEHANAYKATQAMTFKQYCEAMDLLSFSFLQIGTNEVSDKKLTLEWEGRETKLARLLSLAGRFSAEIDFQTFLNRDGTIKRFVVNVYRENDGESQGVGRVRADLVLEYGDEVQTITRHIDKRDVVNAIRPVGKDGLTIDGMSEWKQYTSEGVLEFYQGGSMLYAPLSMQMYPSAFTSTTTNDNWIRRDIDVDTEDKTVLRAAGIKELRKYAYPATTYKVKGFIDADIGDTLTIKDPGFEPLLLLTARVSEQKISFTNHDNNETEFSNFAALANRLSDGIQAALERAIEATKRYTIKPATSAGVIFKNGLGESIMTGTLYKGATPIAQDVTWIWFVNGTYRTIGPNFTVRGSEVSDKLRVTMVAHVKGIEVAREDVDFVNVLDGAAGTVGPNGADGRTTILHIAYANSADGSVSFSVDNPEGREYMGQYTDFEVMDSTDYRRYTWSKIKGDKGDLGPQGLNGLQGPKGDQGLPGAKGADGKTSYTHVAYANSADGQSAFSTSDSNRTYIGVYVDQVATDSADPARYKWTLVKGADGAQGIPGAKGTDGRTPYLHIAYANNSTGTAGFSTTDSAGRTYIGQYTDYTAADSTNPASYKWTLIKGDKGDKGDLGPQGLNGLQGPKGDQGLPGAKGADGKTSYTHVAYANSADGQSAFSTSDSNRTYIGVYVDQVATDSADPVRYKWTLVKGADGAQGVPGAKGADGRTPYLHIAYATNSTGTAGFSTTDSAGRTYIGQYTDYTAADSTNPASYKWTLVKGENGANAYFFVAYADSPDGSSGFSVTDTSKRYMGHYSSNSPTQSTSAASYKWIDMANVTATFVQSTAPTNPPAGSRWKYTGSTVITANLSTINPGEQYLFIGARWVKDVITSDNLQINNQFINGPMIKNGAVTVDKLKVGNLSAISANLGSVNAGKMLLQRSFDAGSSAVPAYNYPAFKTGLFVDNYGLIVNGAPVQKNTSEATASDMPVVAVTSGEVRFLRANLTDNIEEVLHTGLSDPDFGYIQFGRDVDGKNALVIEANGQVYLKGENYTNWTTSTVNAGVRWKVQGNLVIVDYDVTFPTSGTKPIVTVPTKYVPKTLMLTAKAWHSFLDRDRNAQLNADGGLHILGPDANQRYCGQIIWAY